MGCQTSLKETEAQKTEKEMTFETEMDQFFMRNCYSEKERRRVKSWPTYQLAADQKDTIQAQEIATQVLEIKLAASEE